MPSGGPATLSGVLYQLLRSLDWVGRALLTRHDSVHGGDRIVLVMEPAGGGGDLRVIGQNTKLVEQHKSGTSSNTYSFNALLDSVLPDLYRSVDLQGGGDVTYRLVAEAELGDWKAAEGFFRRLPDELPAIPLAALDDRSIVRFARDYKATERAFFEQILTRLREHPHVAREEASVVERKLWHLLSHFEFVGRQKRSDIERRISAFLRAVVPSDTEAEYKRLQLTGLLLTQASAGDAVVDPAQLLAQVGLTALPLQRLAELERRVSESLASSARELRYSHQDDVRTPVAWPADLRALVFTGESGQGKTWQLCSLALNAPVNTVVVITSIIDDDARASWTDAVERAWQGLFSYSASGPLSNLLERIRERRPDLDAPQVLLCFDDVQSVTDLHFLVSRTLHEPAAVRLAVTVPPHVAKAAQSQYPSSVLNFTWVSDFSTTELRDYLERRGQRWQDVPHDVVETLKRPLLARLYSTLASDTGWSPTYEYELYSRYWSRLSEAGSQPDHPQDGALLAGLCLRLLGPNPTYPWPVLLLNQSAITGEIQRRLERIGVISRVANGTAAVWHDRLLNWGVAQALVQAWQSRSMTREQVGGELKRCSMRHAGKSLAYVPLDTIWLLSRPGMMPPAELALLLKEYEGAYPDSLYQELIPTLGPGIIDTLIERLRLADETAPGPMARVVANALLGLARQAPDPVADAAERLIGSESLVLHHAGLRILAKAPRQAVLNRVWTLHKANAAALNSTGRDPLDRYSTSFRALRACAEQQPKWLIEKVLTVDPEDPVWELAYVAATLRAGTEFVWSEIKDHLWQKLPASKWRSFANCVARFRDPQQVPRLLPMLGSPDGFTAGMALRALALVEPITAVDSLDKVSRQALAFTRQWWLPVLLKRAPVETRNRLFTLASGLDLSQLLMTLYSDLESMLDERALEVVLDAVRDEVSGRLAANGVRRTNLYMLLRLLDRVWSPELVRTIQSRAGSELEGLLLEAVRLWSTTQGDHGESSLAKQLLLKMEGSAVWTLFNDELGHGPEWQRVQAYERLSALTDSSADARDLLAGSIPTEARVRKVALSVLLATGRDADFIAVILRGGVSEVDTDCVATAMRRPPFGDATVLPAVSQLTSADATERANAAIAIGLSGRKEMASKLLELAMTEPLGSPVGWALLLSLKWLGCSHPDYVRMCEQHMAIPEHRFEAVNALLGVDTEQSRAALKRALVSEGTLRVEDHRVFADLCEVSGHPQELLEVLWQSTKSLGEHPVAHEVLSELGHSDNPEAIEYLRLIAFEKGGIRNHDGRRDFAIGALSRADSDGAFAATEQALGRQGNRDGVPALMMRVDPGRAESALLRQATRQADVKLQWAIGRELWTAASDSAYQTIAMFLNSPRRAERQIGAELAGWLREPLLADELAGLSMDDPDHDVRQSADAALRRSHDHCLALNLIEQLKTTRGLARLNLVEGIVELMDPLILERQPVFVQEISAEPIPFQNWVQRRLEQRRREVLNDAVTLIRRGSDD